MADGPLKQLVQAMKAKRASRLGGGRVTDSLPGEDVGYPEYDVQSPDVMDSSAGYSPQIYQTGFEGTSADPQEDISLFPEPEAATAVQPAADGDVDIDMGEGGGTPATPVADCKDGNCPVVKPRAGSSMPNVLRDGKVTRQEAPAQTAAAPGRMTFADVGRVEYPIRSGIDGKLLSTYEGFNIEDLQRLAASEMQQSNDFFAANKVIEGTFHRNNALEYQKKILIEQQTQQAYGAMLQAHAAEADARMKAEPDYAHKVRLGILDDLSMTPAQAAYSLATYDLAEQAEVEKMAGVQTGITPASSEKATFFRQREAQALEEVVGHRIATLALSHQRRVAGGGLSTQEAIQEARVSQNVMLHNLFSAVEATDLPRLTGTQAGQAINPAAAKAVIENKIYPYLATTFTADATAGLTPGSVEYDTARIQSENTAKQWSEGLMAGYMNKANEGGVLDAKNKTTGQVIGGWAGQGIAGAVDFAEKWGGAGWDWVNRQLQGESNGSADTSTNQTSNQ